MEIPGLYLSGHVVAGLAFLFLAVFWRYLAVKKGKSWVTANSFQKPSLDGRDAPMTLAWRGAFGGLAWLFFMVLFLVCLFASIDFFLFDGETTQGLVQDILSSV